MAALTPEQAAQILYQAGFRGEDLIKAVAIAGRESHYDPAAHRTSNPGSNTGDFGLMQINYVNDTPQMQQAAGYTSRTQLLDPLTNAKVAFALYQQGGFSAWTAGPGGFSASGDPMYGTNMTAARTAVSSANTQGLLGADYQQSSTSGNSPAPATSNPAAAGGPMTLPRDAVLYNNGYTVIAVFDVGGVKVGYDVNWFDGSVKADFGSAQMMTPDQFASMGVVMAGNAEELRGLSTQFGSYKEYFDSTINKVMSPGNPARNDPGVLAVLAQYAGRPDMSLAEFQHLLQGTDYWKNQTDGQRTWNDLSPAEQGVRSDQKASDMVATWFQFTGEAVSTTDPRIQNYLGKIASGEMGYGAWVENIVKPQALANEHSPWSRQIFDEKKAEKQGGVDIENTTNRVRDLAHRWGVQIPDKTLVDYATQINSNDMSEADVLDILKKQAQILYPWKDPDMDTTTAATPWMQASERIMEKPSSLFDPKVQAALTVGQPVWQFEQTLKKSDDWLGTKNARDEMYTTISEAGRRLGFE